MDTVKLTRSGDAPLVFAGELLEQNDGSRQLGREHTRWHALAIYRTESGRYIARIAYCTKWEGEVGHEIATVVGSGSDVAAVFRDYDPTSKVLGYPVRQHSDAPDPYADRRERLHADIRARYEDQVSQLLDNDVFAEAADLSLYEPFDQQLLSEFRALALLDITFTEAEAAALCDVCNGTIMPGGAWQSLWAEVMDGDRLNGLGEKWKVDCQALAAKLRECPLGTKYAVAHAVTEFWRSPKLNELPIAELLAEVGLLRNEADHA